MIPKGPYFVVSSCSPRAHRANTTKSGGQPLYVDTQRTRTLLLILTAHLGFHLGRCQLGLRLSRWLTRPLAWRVSHRRLHRRRDILASSAHWRRGILVARAHRRCLRRLLCPIGGVRWRQGLLLTLVQLDHGVSAKVYTDSSIGF